MRLHNAGKLMIKKVSLFSEYPSLIPPIKKKCCPTEIVKVAAKILCLIGTTGTATVSFGIVFFSVIGVLSLGAAGLVSAGIIGVAATIATLALIYFLCKSPKKTSLVKQDTPGILPPKAPITKVNSPRSIGKIEEPSPPSSPPLVYPPIGILNTANNCCFNVIAQGIMHIPSWREAFLKDDDALSEDNVLEPCQILIGTYLGTQQVGKQAIPEQVTINLRAFLHEQSQKRAQNGEEEFHDWNAGNQEDSNEILNKLFEYTNNSQLLVDMLHLSTFDESLSSLDQNNLSKLIIAKLPSLNAVNMPAELLIHNHQNFTYTNIKGEFRSKKNPSPFIDENIVSLNLFGTEYCCDYYVYHVGGSPNSGHYTCGININGQWYRISDSIVQVVRDPIEVERELRSAKLIHYRANLGY